jgi:Zn-dependent M28 family amino/carboxypeptidase
LTNWFASQLVVAAMLLQSAALPAFDSNRAWEHLRRLVALGPRPAGSPAIEQSRKYIKSQLSAAAVAVTEQAWDDQTPTGTVHMVNLIATIPGASTDRLIIAGHYDTKRFREFRFVGANDGGSSGAFLVELARVLKARRNPLTIELLFLDGEEAVIEWGGTDRTYGSRYYVANARRTGTLASLKAFVLVDMIGDRDLRLKRELNSTTWLTDIIWSTAQKMGRSEFHPDAVAIEDDHEPFVRAGIPSVDLIDLEYAPWHTAEDTLDQLSARSLQIVADVLLAALPQIERRISGS